MTSPLPPVPGETPEQRQARLAPAYALQARIDQQARDEEARRAAGQLAELQQQHAAMVAAKPASSFDPNAALRQFNEYFGGLRKQYGDAGLRSMGFSPRDLAQLQGSLRKLQMDPTATPEQHRQAYQQARDTLAQRLTMPQPTMQTVAPVAAPVAAQPTAAQLAQHAQTLKSDPNIVSSRWDPTAGGGAGAYEYTAAPRPQPLPLLEPPRRADGPGTVPPWAVPPLPPEDIVVKGQPYVSPVSNFIANMNAPVAAPGGSTNFNEATGVYTKPGNPLTDVLKNAGQVVGASLGASLGGSQSVGAPAPAALPPANPVNTDDFIPRDVRPPMTVMDTLNLARTLGTAPQQPVVPPPMPQGQPSMNTQPGADFDRNIFTRMLNDQFSQLRQKYGDAGLRSAGFTPSTLAGLQGNLRRLSMDPNSTYDQNSAALEAALASMNGYFSPGAGQTGGQQVVPQQPIEVVPQPMPMPQGQPTPGQPVAASAPQPQPTPLAPIPGMYRGGFAVR